MRAIETNDSGTTDRNDPHAIYTLASIGKPLVCRHYDETYALLRQWHALYEQADIEAVRTKCLLASQIKLLFPDYELRKDFLYTPSGHTLIEHYRANHTRSYWKQGTKQLLLRQNRMLMLLLLQITFIGARL